MILWGLFAIVFIRSMIGWEVNVSRNGSYVPKNRVRIAALACLPALAVGNDEGLGVGVIAYLLAFGFVGFLVSKRREGP